MAKLGKRVEDLAHPLPLLPVDSMTVWMTWARLVVFTKRNLRQVTESQTLARFCRKPNVLPQWINIIGLNKP